MERFVLEISARYPECGIVVSGRPDERFSGWQQFYQYSICPFKREQIVSLINKLKFDSIIKSKFIQKIDKDFYQKHFSFLSSPLLASMMLMTFRNYADVPEKIHIFYEQAFDTLYARHDAVKEAFKRTMQAQLSIDIFRRIFRNFCFITYMKEKYEFDESEILNYIDQAIEMEGVEANRVFYFKDLVESVCVLFRDGSKIVFVHRSFQEYFSAQYIKDAPEFLFIDLINRVGQRGGDTVIDLLYDIDRSVLDRNYVIPLCDKYIKGRKIEYFDFLIMIDPVIYVFPDSTNYSTLSKNGNIMIVVAREEFGNLYKIINKLYGQNSITRKKTDVSIDVFRGQQISEKIYEYYKREKVEKLSSSDGEEKKYIVTRKIKEENLEEFFIEFMGTEVEKYYREKIEMIFDVYGAIKQRYEAKMINILSLIEIPKEENPE